ncbi:DMT family transporter [Streptomyces sp. TX20-6-3]|uniref:DMT family transporter n=1 Tax=Streptomyces sp. TX20-6-3 TaxID=3028705 RepID=UPI0029BDDD13|nr:DMT family transporter [Streptomyces sp. TX20-6-3]MDX2561698.1 DMT family transporter [Streptomyces sp. TX20-6-3]
MNPATGTVVAVLLSLVSAAGYALAAVAQSRLAAASPVQDGRGALRALLARGQWWSAVGLNAAGALAHVAALHYGPLTLVQPLGALTLVAALPLGAYAARRRVTRTEWRGALWTLAGLVGLVAVTGPSEPGEALSVRESLVVAAATALLIVTLASGRHPAKGHAPRGLGHATASGIASGVASALTQTLTAAFALELPGGKPAWWQTALLAVLISGFATGGLLLSQAAYRGGLAAPLAVVNLSNPAAAAIIGVALLGETFRAGAWGWLVAAGASLVAARGVVLLTKGGSPEATPATRPDAVAMPEAVAAPEGLAASTPETVAAPEPVFMPGTVAPPASVPEAAAPPDPATPARPAAPSGPGYAGSTRPRTPARRTILRSVPTPRSTTAELSGLRTVRHDPATPEPIAPRLDLPDPSGPDAEPAHAPAAG